MQKVIDILHKEKDNTYRQQTKKEKEK